MLLYYPNVKLYLRKLSQGNLNDLGIILSFRPTFVEARFDDDGRFLHRPKNCGNIGGLAFRPPCQWMFADNTHPRETALHQKPSLELTVHPTLEIVLGFSETLQARSPTCRCDNPM